MNKYLRWIACISLATGCGFGDNQLASRVATETDGGVADACSSCGPGGDAANPPTPDAMVVPPDAAPPEACTLVPQSGCSGSTPACDMNDDGFTQCRAVTALGTSASHCNTDTACKAGYTCAQNTGNLNKPGWCTRFCEDDGDCLGEGSRCVVSFEGTNGILPAQGCTNACDPEAQTGCPSGMGCIAFESPEGDYTDCAYMTGYADGHTCSRSTDCQEGSMCAPDYWNTKRCMQTCVVGSNECYPDYCASLPGHLDIGGEEYGVCQ